MFLFSVINITSDINTAKVRMDFVLNKLSFKSINRLKFYQFL